jgi:hypothetical protein
VRGETVTITPRFPRDDDGNPVDNGDPFDAKALVAPGNTTAQFTDSGNIDSADFTLYMKHGVAIKDGDLVHVRDRDCDARLMTWRTSETARRGGIVVLCTSDTGAS